MTPLAEEMPLNPPCTREEAAPGRRRRQAEVVGELILGRFEVGEPIGSGGMGTVYRARDRRLEREVALKAVHCEHGDDRPRREALAVARLNHPAIVALYELGSQGEDAILVSELVEGETLARLAREGRLADREVAAAGAEICDALRHAHERGVVHRDVKPQNMIVPREGPRPAAKLMDFGVASLAGAGRLTATGEVVGTLAYMAPEQVEGEEPGPAADVYGLALTLYECWAGRNPLERRTPAATVRAIGEPVPPLATARPDLPGELCDRIDACLDPDPDRRPSTGELRGALTGAAPRLRSEPEATAGPVEASPALRAASLLALAGVAGMIAALALPAGRPGLALLLGAVLLLPLLAVPLPHAAAPAAGSAAALLAAPAAAPAFAAMVPTAARRALLGAVGWLAVATVPAASGARPSFGIAERPPEGWESSASATAEALLLPLAGPAGLAGAAIFAAAAVVLGWMLTARHMAVALLGALVWGPALALALEQVGNGGGGAAGLAATAAACVAALVTHRPSGIGLRSDRSHGRPPSSQRSSFALREGWSPGTRPSSHV